MKVALPLDPNKALDFLLLDTVKAEGLGIVKVDAGKDWTRLEFGAKTPVDPLVLVKKVQSSPNEYRLEGANSFRFRLNAETADAKLSGLNGMLRELQP